MSATHADAPVQTAPSKPRPKPSPRTEATPPRRWNVVLLDDDQHTYEYVMRMAQRVFGRSVKEAWLIAATVDTMGRAVLITTHREHAELKREQAIACGRDPLIASCAGAMSVVLEPADPEGGGDDADGGRA